jgi:hypothetical protein
MSTGANFPSGNPLDRAGNLTPQWRSFFLTLFTRSGGTSGNDTSALQDAILKAAADIADLQAEDGKGSPAPDMAAVYAMIHLVESAAAQAMAAATRQYDERGDAGEGAGFVDLSQRVAELEGQLEQYRSDDALRIRIADLESKIEAISAPQITDTSQMTNGAGYLASANNLSDVASATTAASNLGLGTLNTPTFAGMSATGAVSAVAPVSGSYAGTFAANGVPTQYVAIGGDSTVNRVDSFSPAGGAKLLSFNSTTTSGNTTPTSGSVGMRWMVLGVIKMFLNQAGRFLIGTTTDDGSGNLLQVASGLSITPTTTTTAPTAGGAGALPATPTGYATIRIGGTDRKVAYY